MFSIVIHKNTPAITIVELCDSDDIGVGAGIAFNNHVLLVSLPIKQHQYSEFTNKTASS